MYVYNFLKLIWIYLSAAYLPFLRRLSQPSRWDATPIHPPHPHLSNGMKDMAGPWCEGKVKNAENSYCIVIALVIGLELIKT